MSRRDTAIGPKRCLSRPREIKVRDFSQQERIVLEAIARMTAVNFRAPRLEDIESDTGLNNARAVVEKLYRDRVIEVARPRKPRSPRRWAIVEGVSPVSHNSHASAGNGGTGIAKM